MGVGEPGMVGTEKGRGATEGKGEDIADDMPAAAGCPAPALCSPVGGEERSQAHPWPLPTLRPTPPRYVPG